MPRSPESELIQGVVFAYKPPGMSSSRLVALLKKRLGGVKTGHTGTLDRFAEGFMILLTGGATSFSDFFLHMDKTYTAVISFGRSTDTHDPTGLTLQEESGEKTDEFIGNIENRLACIVSEFEKTSHQTPPVYSALKKDGIRFSDRARKGEVQLPEGREVRICRARLLKLDKEKKTCECEFHVSSGTYIRSIVRDLSERLEFPAHLSELRRNSVGSYSLSDSRVWRELDDPPHVISVMELLDWPRVIIGEELILALKNGQKIPLEATHDGNFFLVSPGGMMLSWVVGHDGDYTFKRVFK